MSINVKDYETQTLRINRKNVSVPGKWLVALDIGYSAVKGFSPNSVFAFPSFAKKTTGDRLEMGHVDDRLIQYRADGDVWNVGYVASANLKTGDTNDTASTLYSRNRYFSPMFLVLARTGMAMGMLKNEYGNPEGSKLSLMTGLPPAYLAEDTPILREALAGRHSFDIRFGSGGWQHFEFELSPRDIRIISQPMGSFLSAILDNDCNEIADAGDYFSSKVLTVDGGFGTADIFSIINGDVGNQDTFDEFGMKAVLQETADMIRKQHGVDIPIPHMQKILHDGYFKKFDRRTRQLEQIPFDSMLEEASRKVCLGLLTRLDQMYNYLVDYDYLLITGGTCAAWHDIIREYYSGIGSLKIIGGNRNDNLSHIFSNVRGYYLYGVGSSK